MKTLVVEFHYDDGDCGAYETQHPPRAEDLDACAHHLWTFFAENAKPSHIVIRAPTAAEGGS